MRTMAATLTLALAAVPAIAQVSSYKDIKSPPLRPFTIPVPERYVMKNGMVVMLMEDHELPLVVVSTRIRTGARLEPAEKAGLAGLTGTVMRTGGAGSRTGDEIDDLLDAHGAVITTAIFNESGSASLNCLKNDFPEMLKVFADVVRRPRFEEAKLKVARNQARTGISRRNDDPMGIMFREVRALVYGPDSPYARKTEYATIDSITQADVKAFHGKYFTPNRVLLGVVGDFNPAEMKKTLESVFGDWAKGPEIKDPVAAYRTTPKPGIYRIEKNDMTQSDVIMAHLGIRTDSPDYFAAQVMNEAYSGASSSRLFSDVRTKRGLAYAVAGGLSSNFDYPGTFNTWVTTKTETTGAAIDALLENVEQLVAKPPTQEEVDRAKTNILNSFIFNYDSRGEILAQQLTYAYYGYPADFLSKYRDNVEKVTPADVARVAKTYVKRSDLAILVIGPKEGLDKPLDTYGRVTAYDITIPDPAAPPSSVALTPGVDDKDAAARGSALLGKVIDSLGGGSKIDAVRNTKVVATMSMQTPRGEATVKVTQLSVLPDRIRQDLETPMGAMSMVVTPADSYMSTPMGVRPMTDSQKSELLKSLTRDPVLLLRHRSEPGFSVRYEGSDAVESVKTDVLAVTWGGETYRFAIDPATGHILRSTTRGAGPGGGPPGERVALFSDFRTVDGVTFPFKSKLLFNGEAMGSSDIEEITVNMPVDESLFAKPASAPSGN